MNYAVQASIPDVDSDMVGALSCVTGISDSTGPARGGADRSMQTAADSGLPTPESSIPSSRYHSPASLPGRNIPVGQCPRGLGNRTATVQLSGSGGVQCARRTGRTLFCPQAIGQRLGRHPIQPTRRTSRRTQGGAHGISDGAIAASSPSQWFAICRIELTAPCCFVARGDEHDGALLCQHPCRLPGEPKSNSARP